MEFSTSPDTLGHNYATSAQSERHLNGTCFATSCEQNICIWQKGKHTQKNTSRFETKTMKSIGMEMILVILLQEERVKTAMKQLS